MISGIPSSSTPSSSITIEASNELGSIDTQLSFVVKSLSTLSIILISLVILIIIIIVIIMIIVIVSKKKKPTLPKKSLEEVKSVEKRVVNRTAPAPAVPAPNQSTNSSPPIQSNIALFTPVSSTISSVPSKHYIRSAKVRI